MTIHDVAMHPTLTGDTADARRPSQSSLLAPVAVFIALSAADALMSVCLLRAGLMREANPIMSLALSHLGLSGIVSAKLVVAAVAASLLAACHPVLPHVTPRLAWTANALYLLAWGCGFLAVNLGPLVSLAA